MRQPYEKMIGRIQRLGCFNISAAVIACTVDVVFLTVALSREGAPASSGCGTSFEPGRPREEQYISPIARSDVAQSI
jgi:hypothetical protein